MIKKACWAGGMWGVRGHDTIYGSGWNRVEADSLIFIYPAQIIIENWPYRGDQPLLVTAQGQILPAPLCKALVPDSRFLFSADFVSHYKRKFFFIKIIIVDDQGFDLGAALYRKGLKEIDIVGIRAEIMLTPVVIAPLGMAALAGYLSSTRKMGGMGKKYQGMKTAPCTP